MMQVTKVWWDGEKLMAEPIDPAAVYKEPQQPAQQEPVAKKKHEPKIDLGKYAGTYGGYITPEPSEGYLQKAYRLANELRSHLSIAPPQRTWVGLTDEELREFDVDPIEAKLMIAKLRSKNEDRN